MQTGKIDLLHLLWGTCSTWKLVMLLPQLLLQQSGSMIHISVAYYWGIVNPMEVNIHAKSMHHV